MNSNKLAFIGGSGIYKLDILNKVVEHDLFSSFGQPSSKILEGKINGNSICVLPELNKQTQTDVFGICSDYIIKYEELK